MVWGQNVREIFGKSLHRTDILVYRLLTLNFVSFLTKISTRQLFTIANSNSGIYGRYTVDTLLELFALHTHEFCLRTQINLIAYSRCFNWVNTQIRCLSGALIHDQNPFLGATAKYQTLLIWKKMDYCCIIGNLVSNYISTCKKLNSGLH